MEPAASTRRTKIIATWGPAVASPGVLRALVRAGVDVFRLNCSHATHEELSEAIPRIRAAAEAEGRTVALMLDVQGPRLRTGTLPGGEPVTLERGALVRITTEETAGDAERIAIHHPGLADDLRPGQRILIADGRLVLRVQAVEGAEVTATVVAGGALGEHKGVNLPDSDVRVEALTPKDREDLAFGVAQGVDFVALSFVRRSDDLRACRSLIHALGGDQPLIAKIEHPLAVASLEGVLEAADGVMVARGDLGVEVSPERVPLLQKRIITRANELGIPVITATQMLESMVERPVPTRAEASDVTNAVLDGTDALMLSAETAVGRHPVETVETMARIAVAAEAASPAHPVHDAGGGQPHAVAQAARELADALDAAAMLVFTRSGMTARTLSHQRPPMPIYALSPMPAVCRRLSLWYGVQPLLSPITEDAESMVQLGLSRLREEGAVAPGATVVVFGTLPVQVGGPPNLINVRAVPQVGS